MASWGQALLETKATCQERVGCPGFLYSDEDSFGS